MRGSVVYQVPRHDGNWRNRKVAETVHICTLVIGAACRTVLQTVRAKGADGFANRPCEGADGLPTVRARGRTVLPTVRARGRTVGKTVLRVSRVLPVA